MKKLTAILLFVGMVTGGIFYSNDAVAETSISSYEQAVIELLHVLDLQGSLQQTFDASFALQLQQNPALMTYESIIKDFLQRYLRFEALQPDFIAIYKKHFTEPEIREMITFYKTPVGIKSIQMMSVLFQEVVEIGQRKVMEHQDELMQQLQNAMVT